MLVRFRIFDDPGEQPMPKDRDTILGGIANLRAKFPPSLTDGCFLPQQGDWQLIFNQTMLNNSFIKVSACVAKLIIHPVDDGFNKLRRRC